MAVIGFDGRRAITTWECLECLKEMAAHEKHNFKERNMRESVAIRAGIEAMETYHRNCTDRQIRQLDYLERNPAAVIILEPGIKNALLAAIENLEIRIQNEQKSYIKYSNTY